MPAPVMPLRKCLITLLQAKINMGKLHRPALHCNAMHCTALHCTYVHSEGSTCLFAVEFSSFYLGPGVFALVIGSEAFPERLPDALLPLTTHCLHLA